MATEERKKRARSERRGHKSSATRIMTRVTEMLASPDALDRPKLSQLERSLKEKLQEIKAMDAEILKFVTEEEMEEITQADLYKERIYSTLISIEDTLKPSAATASVALATATRPVPSTTPENKVRLPKLTIKPFNGKLTAWTPFWDSFNSAIHENPELSKVDKFNYLRSMVTHAAAEAICGLTLTSANYDEAIEVLKKRFGNKQLIVNKHMEQLLNVEGVSSQHDVKGLRHLYDVIESNVRSLKSLGVSAESYGSLLSAALMSKLPSELRLTASRKFGDKDSWDFTDLLKVIEEEVQARERSSAHREEHRRNKDLPTGAALFVKTAPRQCCFCRRDHPSQDCRTVVGVDSRREAFWRSGRCYTCLGRGHLSRNCRSKVRCLSCQGRHHVAVCDKSSPRAVDLNCDSTSEPMSALNPDAPTYSPQRLILCGLALTNLSFYRQHRLLHSTLTTLLRRQEFES